MQGATRILVVEDYPLDAELIERELPRAGIAIAVRRVAKVREVLDRGAG